MEASGGITGLIERRSLWQLVAGYAVAAWALLQVVDTVGSFVGLPLWFGSGVLTLLVCGLAVVVATGLLQGRSAAAPGARGLRRLFTWRHAGAAGLAGALLLVAGAAAFAVLRSQGLGPAGTLLARGVLDERDQVVVADFADHVGDPGLVNAIQQAFRVHLSQSPALSLASRSAVAEVLARMEAEPGVSLDAETAREAAVREGWKAVVAGEVHPVGSGYTVSVRLVAAESGEELGSWIEDARREDDLIPAVERLSVRLRERVGESLGSLGRAPRLQKVRTSSLEALRLYTEGADANGRGEFERCALLMEQAIELDSTFAMAFAGRAGCNQNLARNMALQVSDRIRAYGMRDRMTEEERLRFTAIYHQFVTRDREQAVQAWEAYAERYPRSSSALFSLANLYAEGREWARAEETLRRGAEVDPGSPVVLINLAGYRFNQGRTIDAEAALDSLAAVAPGVELGWWRATMRLAAADWDAARRHVGDLRERLRGNVAQRAQAASLESHLALTLGRLDEAERLAQEAIDSALDAGSIEWYHLHSVHLAGLHLHARGDTTSALAAVDAALAAHPLEGLDPFERRYLELAEIYARAGRLDRARALLADWQREVAPLIPGTVVPHWLRAALAEAEGRHGDAIAEWRLEDAEIEDPLPALAHVGAAHDRLGRPDSAIAYFEKYLETPSRLRYDTDALWRGRVLERLGQLLEAAGEAERAAPYHRSFVALWDRADETLQPRVDAASDRLRALAEDGVVAAQFPDDLTYGTADGTEREERREGFGDPLR